MNNLSNLLADADPALKKFGLGIMAGVGIAAVFTFSQSVSHQKKLRKAVQERQKFRRHQFQRLRAELDTDDEELAHDREIIISLTLKQLIDKLQAEELSAEQVLEAYQWRALYAQKKTNCICLFVEEASFLARSLDHKYKGKAKPPLFGIPISIKENIYIKGHDANLGCARILLENDIQTDDGEYVKLLKELGAVPFVRTNIPQTMLSYSCSNPIYGETRNSIDETRSPGGSSGGEGALIACKGSILGIGSDTGGSIRVPAHHSGVAGFRATSFRCTRLGGRFASSTCPGVYSVRGPLARDVASLIKFFELYWDTPLFTLDPLVVPRPFNRADCFSEEPLKIGYFSGDPFFQPVPACVRAVEVARGILQEIGHTLIEIKPISVKEVSEVFWALLLPDKGKTLYDNMKADILDENHGILVEYYRSNMFYKLQRLVRHMRDESIPNYNMVPSQIPLSIQDYRALLDRAEKLRKDTSSEWRSLGLDAVVCPAFGTIAVASNVMPRAVFTGAYASMYNLLDFPAGIVPVTLVSEKDEEMLEDEYDRTTEEGAWIYKACKRSLGLPVGVQIAGLPYKDEVCLRVMQDIENFLKE